MSDTIEVSAQLGYSIPSTSAVSSVTLAAFLRPAGRFSPILSSFSLRERPPFLDLALGDNESVVRMRPLRKL